MNKYYCWVDETYWPGPYQEDQMTLGEVFKSFTDTIIPITNLFSSYSTMLDVLVNGDVRYDPLAARRAYNARLLKYEEERRKKAAFLDADRRLNVPAGTSERLASHFDSTTERERKRQIGKGNVAGKGPRPATTFNVRGKKAY